MAHTQFQDSRTINPLQFQIFGGLDVDKKSISVVFQNHSGMVKSLHIPYSAEHLINYTREHFKDQEVAFAYEAGPTGLGLYDHIEQAGFRCLVVSPALLPKAPNERVKTNRLDAKKLASFLRGGQLKTIHVPSLTYRQLRQLVHLRDIAVKGMVAAKCRIKSLLLLEGLSFPPTPPHSQWSCGALDALRHLPCPPAIQFKLRSLLDSLVFHQTQAVEAIREIRRFCRQDTELQHNIQLLQTIPGIGWIVASHILARVGDYRAMGNVRQLASFLGLVGCENSTGDQVHRGSITRLGDVRLRNKLIQAAWSSISKDPELRDFYRRIYHRHPKDRGSRKAIVAVARKLTTRIYAVLKNQRPYEVREHSSRPLSQEETIRPRVRLDDWQNTSDVLS